MTQEQAAGAFKAWLERYTELFGPTRAQRVEAARAALEGQLEDAVVDMVKIFPSLKESAPLDLMRSFASALVSQEMTPEEALASAVGYEIETNRDTLTVKPRLSERGRAAEAAFAAFSVDLLNSQHRTPRRHAPPKDTSGVL